MLTITGAVLAGGASRRMGREKAWLPMGAQPMIERIITRLRPHVERIVVIANTHNAVTFENLPVNAVWTDLAPDRGPLMGLYTGVMRATTDLMVFVPCDMPLVDSRLIEPLVRACGEDPALIAAAGAHHSAGLQPFPLACRVSAGRAIGALLDRRVSSVREFLAHPRVGHVVLDGALGADTFANINTVADYAHLQPLAPDAP